MQFHLHSLGIPAPRPAPASARPVSTSFLVALPAIATDMDNSSAFMPVAVAAVVVVVAVAVAAAASAVSAVLVSTLDLHKARSTAQDVVSDKPNLFCLFEETTEDVEASRLLLLPSELKGLFCVGALCNCDSCVCMCVFLYWAYAETQLGRRFGTFIFISGHYSRSLRYSRHLSLHFPPLSSIRWKT